MQRTAIVATLLSFALAGGAAAQPVTGAATGAAVGAARGAAAGAATGAAVAGPVGAAVGAPVGAAAGAVTGAATGAVAGTVGAVARGPLVVNVTPGAPAAVGVVPPGVGRTVVINGVVYDRVPARVLFTTGPRYTERSGVRVGRGSVIPAWVNTAPMRNVSIRRLQPGAFYGYFVSPDNKVVVIEPNTRRVARVISRAG